MNNSKVLATFKVFVRQPQLFFNYFSTRALQPSRKSVFKRVVSNNTLRRFPENFSITANRISTALVGFLNPNGKFPERSGTQ
eukprot:2385775-Amphidinium_carterae.1